MSLSADIGQYFFTLLNSYRFVFRYLDVFLYILSVLVRCVYVYRVYRDVCVCVSHEGVCCMAMCSIMYMYIQLLIIINNNNN